jgi:hypothetical protein
VRDIGKLGIVHRSMAELPFVNSERLLRGVGKR